MSVTPATKPMAAEPHCFNCGGDGIVEYDPPDISMAPAYRDCDQCCGTGRLNGCPEEKHPDQLDPATLTGVIMVLREHVLNPLERGIEHAKHGDRPIGDYKLIPASFFTLLSAEQDTHKLIFALENARRTMEREG